MAVPESTIRKQQRAPSLRIRFKPQQLTYGSPSPQHKASPAEEAMRNDVRQTRDQLEQMKQMNRNSMLNNACPLLCADVNMDWPPPTHNMDELESVQPKRKGLAADGFEYDLERLKKYIRGNMDRQLLSPVTGEPMAPYVAFVGKGRSKKDPTHKLTRLMEWRPGIDGAEDKVTPARV